MNSLYIDLAWLPRPPEDLSARFKSLPQSVALGAQILELAQYGLNLNQLTRLSKAIGYWHDKDASALKPLVPFRLAVLSNSTFEMIAPALIATAARHGIALELILPAYDQIAQEAMNPDSKVNAAKPDAVLLALDYRGLPLRVTPGDATAAAATTQAVYDYLKALREGLSRFSGAVCVWQSLAPPVETLFGSLDRTLPGTLRSLIEEVNGGIGRMAVEHGDVLLDVAGIAETVGLADWHDSVLWNMAKLPFCDRMVPLYADHVARTIAALRGKSRKVLILDLDNTLWGGVIGDDGLEGIRVAQGDAQGEAHLAVQSLALSLRDRGILLAVSSKNTDAVARKPFEKHPEMRLKLEHFAMFQANWTDKATNIQAIAESLSLGLDAMVFLDDNPVERGLVRRLLPQVAVPELPEEPAHYARTLAAAGYFEAVSVSAEDLRRASLYQDNVRRAELQQQAGGVEAYLASLQMKITFKPFDATNRARIVQLINKSNQYNLTTRRYTEPEITALMQDAAVFTLQVRLADMFGDNGMISVVICRPGQRAEWVIDTWLMSCRVLARKVEHMVLGEILRQARRAGVEKVVGEYIPTERNGLVTDHYAKLGFTRVGENAAGASRWELAVAGAMPQTAPMEVICEPA